MNMHTEDSFFIARVFKKRGFIRVVFSNNQEDIALDFSNKFGQYDQFKKEMKNKLNYTREWVSMYLN